MGLKLKTRPIAELQRPLQNSKPPIEKNCRSAIPDERADPIAPVALDDRIASLERELVLLKQRRAERDHAAILLAILQLTDSWFQVHELLAAADLNPHLSRWLAGKSAKSVGRLLRTIADVQDGHEDMPALRLLRHARTNGGALWKVETHACSSARESIGG